MQQHTVILKKEQHREQDVLSIYMPQNAELNTIVKKLGAHYSTYGTVLQPIYWKLVGISDTYKPFWGITAVKQQKFIRT